MDLALPSVLPPLLDDLSTALRARGWRMATAESCTGGGVARWCTELAGSSDWFEAALVTYSNGAKQALLGVPAGVIEVHGAVSEPVALAMAEGALARTEARAALSITGVAGPGGGSAAKPVGTVWIGWAVDGAPARAARFGFEGDRAAVREQAGIAALQGLLAQLA